MKICERCMMDETLRSIINNVGKPGRCDICHQETLHAYDTDKHNDLTPYFEQLIRIYKPFELTDSEVPQSGRKFLQSFIHEKWNIFTKSTAEDQIGKALIAICPEMYHLDKRLFEGLVFLENAYNADYLEDHALFRNFTWDAFAINIKQVNRFHSNFLNLDLLQKFCSFLKMNYRKGQLFYRCRLSNDSTGYAKEKMGAPPIECTQDNRISPRGIRCLYLAESEETTIFESRAAKYDYASIGTFELQQDISVVDLTKIKSISPFIDPDGMVIEELAVNRNSLEKIDEILGKPVRKSDSYLDYIPTQYIADYIKSITEKGKQVYQGIRYKSVMHDEGYNVAAFDPDLFLCVNVYVKEINDINYHFNRIK